MCNTFECLVAFFWDGEAAMIRTRFHSAIFLAVIMVSAFSAAGLAHGATLQDAKSAPETEGASPSTTPSTVLKTSANLVLVDVVVTNRGKPVLAIPMSRFHVFENGKERPIVAFDEHRPAQSEPNVAALKAQLASLPSQTFTNLPLYPSTGVVNVMLLDALNTPMADQAEARAQMIEYMKTVPAGTSMAIFTLASHLQMVEGFTTNAAKLAAAMKSKGTASSQSVITEPQNSSAQRDIEQAVADVGADSDSPSPEVIGAMLQFESDLTDFQTNMRVRMTLDALDELARYLSGIPGRKNVIWFSGSFPITLNPDENQTSYRNVENYSELIRQTSDLLTAARVAVYPIDARGLFNSPTARADYMPSPNTMSVSNRGRLSRGSVAANVDRDAMRSLDRAEREHDSMTTIAEETGGRAFYNRNDLKAAVADAINNGESFYTLGFVPAGKLDGHFRKIKVGLSGGRYELAYRLGYYADPSNRRSEHNRGVEGSSQAAILHGAPDSTQVLFAARVLPATDPEFKGLKMPGDPVGEMASKLKGPLRRYLVDFTVDALTLKFNSEVGGMREDEVEFVLMAYDASGNRVNYQDHSYVIRLNSERYAWTMAHGLRARMALDLPAGRESLRVAVVDLDTQHTGSLEVPLTIAAK